MNQEIKKKWVAALRSGKYEQKGGRLKCENGFCCLGVLTDLHQKEIGKEWGIIQGQEYFLSGETRDWAELGANDPTMEVEDTRKDISDLNDNYGWTFKELADLIEEQL